MLLKTQSSEGARGLHDFKQNTVIENLYNHVAYLSVTIGERHIWNRGSLGRAVEYIESAFQECGYTVQQQTYSCYGTSVSNLIAQKTGTEDGYIIVGAHYDTMPGTPGADDNASAVAGLLELARLHAESKSSKHLVFAAFVNEEPPCYGSYTMGSMIYARHLREQGVPVDVMISLEMIGYFRHELIQHYPLPGMGLVYPRMADFIGVVGNLRSFRCVSRIKKGIRRYSAMKAYSLIAPEYFGGISLSDNYAFWRHGYRAVMVTDTSFFRNRHYHQETDTIDTLNFEAMAEVVKGLYYTLLTL